MSNYGDKPGYPQGPKQTAPQTSPQRIRAARDESRLYVATLADWVQGGFLPFADAEREVTEYFQALAQRFALTPDELASARNAEWIDANRDALARLDALRRVIRRHAWDGAPLVALVAATVAEADRVHANFGNSHLEIIIAAIAGPIQQSLSRRGRS